MTESQDMKKLADQVKKVSNEHWTAWKNKHMEGTISRWRPTLKHFIKINVDAAVRDNFTLAAAVLRDHRGDFNGAATKLLVPLQPVEAEEEAALFGVQEAWQRGFRQIILEGDAATVTRAVNNYSKRRDCSD